MISTHFSSFEFLLTLQSFILYVSHPEPQVCHFLVPALRRTKKKTKKKIKKNSHFSLSSEKKTWIEEVWGDCDKRGGDFLPKVPNIILRSMSHWKEFENPSPHMQTNARLRETLRLIILIIIILTAFIPKCSIWYITVCEQHTLERQFLIMCCDLEVLTLFNSILALNSRLYFS